MRPLLWVTLLVAGGGRHCYKTIFQIIYYNQYEQNENWKKPCCVVYKVHFVVFECMYTHINIHTNLDMQLYTQMQKTHSIAHTVGLYGNGFLVLHNSQESLAFVPIEKLTLCTGTVLCLLQSEIKPFLLS